MSLCHALIATAAQRGARLIRDEAVGFDGAGRSAAVSLASGHVVEADHVVLATGYVMPDLVRDDLHSVASSGDRDHRAAAPHIVAGAGPRLGSLRGLLLLPDHKDDRIVFGGEDEPTSPTPASVTRATAEDEPPRAGARR